MDFLFENGSITKGSIISINADSCKVLNTAIIDYNPLDHKTEYIWVHFKGSYNTLENCFLKRKK
jgi:poly(beta-D-mannuronate) lyase